MTQLFRCFQLRKFPKKRFQFSTPLQMTEGAAHNGKQDIVGDAM